MGWTVRVALGIAVVALALGCDRRTEIPTASSPAACEAMDLGAAENLLKRSKIPVDRVVTFEGMPHPAFFGWTQDGQQRAVSKLLGTERQVLLFQEFDGEAPPSSTKMTGMLRKMSDLPAVPWDGVRDGIQKRFNWEVPENAYVLMEGFTPEGCD